MKQMREAAVAGVLRTPFVKPESSFGEVPVPDIIRLVIGELLFFYAIDPSSIDTVFIASPGPVPKDALEDLRSACRSLGFDSHFKLVTVCSGGISDMVALTEAAMHVIAGESNVSLVAGASIGVGGGAGGINDVRWTMDRFPFHEVVDRYPSTCNDRLSFRNESVRKAKDTASGSHGTGLIPLSLPPYFDRLISRDDLMDYEPEPFPAVYGTWCEGPPAELVFDFSAPYREGAGVIALKSMENSSYGAPDIPLRLTGFRHLGIPPHLGGLGAAVALESLLSDKNDAVKTIDVVEILELTTAQTISSLERIRSLLPRDGDNGGDPRAVGPVFSVNPCGGSLVYGHVPACSGILMIASLMEYLDGTRSRTGAVLCEDPSGEAVALTFERGWGEND